MKTLHLDVTINKHSGFCFGVVEAIKKAEEILSSGKQLYCLGQIVHNEAEINRLEQKGMKTIYHDAFKTLKNATVLFRAHGEPPESYEVVKKNNIRLVDASCPIVTTLQKKVKKAYDNGEAIYIFGKHHHPEVIGLIGQTNNTAVVFQSIDELDLNNLPAEITMFSQTTRDKNEYNKIARIIQQTGTKVKLHNSICGEVANRQPEIKKFCKHFDKVVFIAGAKSSNGRVLYNVCKESNRNTFFISDVSEIKKEWFAPYETVGICGATSTPQWLMEKTKERLLEL